MRTVDFFQVKPEKLNADLEQPCDNMLVKAQTYYADAKSVQLQYLSKDSLEKKFAQENRFPTQTNSNIPIIHNKEILAGRNSHTSSQSECYSSID